MSAEPTPWYSLSRSRRPVPGPHEVHIWCACLNPSRHQLQALDKILNQQERHRAAQFRLIKHRERFVAAHGALRNILSRYAEQEPAELRFYSRPQGKPALTPSSNKADLRFNLSHAEDIALVAITRGHEVGVDVERIRPEFCREGIAESCFSSNEAAFFQGLSQQLQPAAFFRCWTRKEAYLKALGQGLRAGFDSFDVSMIADPQAAVVNDRDRTWSIRDLPLEIGYAAAVAVEDTDPRVLLWRWRGLQES